MSTDKSVLSIQSHVVHGYVGNRAATFPLQLRGWDVDALNVVNYSNHTGYGQFTGSSLSGEQILDLYEGLKRLDFSYDALLTGYLPNAAAVSAVLSIAENMKSRLGELVWLFDPVMGDEGKLYVAKDVIPRSLHILQKSRLVTITTPNHFEAEIIAGTKLETQEDIKKALLKFHMEYKIPNVVITSIPHPTDPAKLLTVGSSSSADSNAFVPFCITQRKFDGYFTGTGDLFAALLLDNYKRYGASQFSRATLETIKTLRKVLLKTWEHAQQQHLEQKKIGMSNKAMRFHELRLVQNADVLKPVDTHDEGDDPLEITFWN